MAQKCIEGDAAHVIPPTAGHGTTQAIEGFFTLAVLLPTVTPKCPLDEILTTWKDMH
ncbi:hypothetical protein GQ44DRAFT_705784 [Phaeosphaeriaceae sp. PMI808]|nr:hypothetical protein GQ44DRAFT_705784 [Phaeosphaeriaceae sp. PMI808]